jgi:predicted transcriptional regulator
LRFNVLHPSNRDIRFALGDLEAAIVEELWKSGQPLSVKDFHERVSRNRQVAVTTVATILDRLYRKGILSRKLMKEGGPHYLYSPRLSEEQFKHAIVNNVMGTLLRSFNDVTVAYLTDKMAGTSGDRRVISKYMSKLRREAER